MKKQSIRLLAALAMMFAMSHVARANNELIEIGTAEQLAAFAEYVTSERQEVDARLTADIDYTGYDKVIGASCFYCGTFDGQGHKITIKLSGSGDYLGLFNNLGGTGVIKNLIVDGSLTTSGKNAGGLCGQSSGLISHCVSYVTINCTREGDSGHGGFVGQTYNDAKFEYCLSAGKFVSETTTHCGGFVGWKGWGTTMVNSCLEIMEAQLPTLDGCNPFVRGGYTSAHNYYSTSMGDGGDAVSVTADQLASGEACFMLNGDQSSVQWFQTIGDDKLPTPFETSKRVYAIGSFNCDGVTPLGVTSYSNTDGNISVAPHSYVDGVCTVCKALDENYCELIDGAYQIGNASQMYWFTQAVKKNYSANVAITADFDYSGYSSRIAGTYKGTFDGQGHKITYAQESTAANAGFIKNLGKGGVIKNLILDGTITTSGKNAGGITGRCNGTISHCVSYVTINSTCEGDAGHGGITGATYDGATIEYCVSAGKFVSDNSTNCGGYVGWNDWGATVINSCLQVMEISLPNTEGSSTFGRGGDYTYTNNYYENALGDTNNATSVTSEQLGNGATCYLLNGDQSNVQWFQTLGKDIMPVPFNSSLRVYAIGNFSCDGVTSLGTTSYSNTEGGMSIAPHDFVEGFCTVCKALDENYCELIDGAYQIGNASQMYWFTQAVKKNYSANVAITSDFDYSGYSSRIAGTYKGTFDGQGHKITYAQESTAANAGFIKNLGKGGVIKNLILDGTITTSGKNAGGITGRCNGTISHCVSYVTINSTCEGDAGHGGITGSTYDGATIEYCVSAGKFVSDNSTNCGGYVGWNDWGATAISHCLEIMDVKLPTLEGCCAFGRGGDYANTDNYYVTDMSNNNGATQLSVAQMASGEACCLMNGNGIDVEWHQNIGTDMTPLPYASHGRVLPITETGYATLFVPGTKLAIPNDVKVYTGIVKGDCVILNEVSDAIPENTPVVLQGKQGYYSFVPTTSAAEVGENDLKGTAEPLKADGTQFVLAAKNGVAGFYQAETETTIPAGKAYLAIAAPSVKMLTLGNATGPDIIRDSTPNAQNTIYDLSGRRVTNMRKGIYVVNGKKLLK